VTALAVGRCRSRTHPSARTAATGTPSYAVVPRGQAATGPQSEAVQRRQSTHEDAIHQRHAAAIAVEAALQKERSDDVFVGGLRAAPIASLLSEMDATLEQVGCAALPTGVQHIGECTAELDTIQKALTFDCERHMHALYSKTQ